MSTNSGWGSSASSKVPGPSAGIATGVAVHSAGSALERSSASTRPSVAGSLSFSIAAAPLVRLGETATESMPSPTSIVWTSAGLVGSRRS